MEHAPLSLIKPSRWLMQQVKRAQGWLYLTVLLGLLSGLLIILQAYWLARVIDQACMHHQAIAALWPELLGILLCFLVRAGILGLKSWASFHIGASVRAHVREALTAHLLKISPLKVAQISSGALSALMLEQVEALQNFCARYYPQMIFAVLLPILILVMVFPHNWIAGLVLLITAPLIPLFMALVGMGASALHRENFVALERLGAKFVDVLQGFATLKLFDQSQHQAQVIERSAAGYRQKTMRVLRVAFLSSATLEFFASLSIALIATWLGLSLLGYIHWGEYGHGLTLWTALFILLLAPEFYLPLKELGVYYHDRAAAIGASEAILAILQKPVLHDAKPGVLIETREEGVQVSVKNLFFTYPKAQHPTISNLSFTLKPNTCMAIVGVSGVGKSTLLQLLAGNLMPDSGELYLNGVSRQEASLASWRGAIGFLSQKPKLLPGSVKENIQLVCPEASDTRILKAAQDAGLNLSLDHQIGEQNAGISVGQAQRIALARVFLKEAKLILLDEPTASLDAKHQAVIMDTIFRQKHRATWIIVTHHLDTITHCDEIWTIEQGTLAKSL